MQNNRRLRTWAVSTRFPAPIGRDWSPRVIVEGQRGQSCPFYGKAQAVM